MEKTFVFIDSGNFYHLVLKKMGLSELEFDIDEFAKFLAGDRILPENGKKFYVGTVREKQDGHETKKAMAEQTKLFAKLKNNRWDIQTSKLRYRQENVTVDNRVADYKHLQALGIKKISYERSREKGIDVKLAIDLIAGALDNLYDTAIVVSSDTDLVPAVEWIRNRFKKKIEYVGFSIACTNPEENTKPTNRMIYSSDIQRVLSSDDIKRFVIKNLFNN